MRVPQFLAEQRIPYEMLRHPPAFSAQHRAKYLHVSGRQVVKAVLLVGPPGYFLAILQAACQVDTAQLEHAFAGPVRLATAAEVAEVFRDCEWGAGAPFGTLYGLTTILDDSLAPETVIIFEVHSHAMAIRMRCLDFERLERPRRLRFARPG
jgi:Ala-tRNA(Pro) deacylase